MLNSIFSERIKIHLKVVPVKEANNLEPSIYFIRKIITGISIPVILRAELLCSTRRQVKKKIRIILCWNYRKKQDYNDKKKAKKFECLGFF